MAGILVGVALLGVLTLGMMELFSSMLKNQNYNKFRTQIDSFGEEFRNQLGSGPICTSTFSGIQLDPATTKSFSAIKDPTGKNIYQVNTDMGDHSFQIASIDLKSTTGSPWYIEDNPATLTGRMILIVTYRASADQAGPKEAFRTYTLSTHRDASGKLIDCVAMSKMSDGLWHHNPASVADIYYSDGNVGIGTDSPKAKLEINGDVKFGNTGAGCSGATEGQQHYNYTTHTMEYCNGTTWVANSGGLAGCSGGALHGDYNCSAVGEAMCGTGGLNGASCEWLPPYDPCNNTHTPNGVAGTCTFNQCVNGVWKSRGTQSVYDSGGGGCL